MKTDKFDDIFTNYGDIIAENIIKVEPVENQFTKAAKETALNTSNTVKELALLRCEVNSLREELNKERARAKKTEKETKRLGILLDILAVELGAALPIAFQAIINWGLH